MKIISVDWNDYLDIFPDRYIQPNQFDTLAQETVSDLIGKLRSVDAYVYALDIGGGAEGTSALNNRRVHCWLADPFVTWYPEWMVKQVNHVTDLNQTFDLIVARGSFNYLTPEEIRAIPKLLKPNGIFLFNTFSEPKTGERAYTNSLSETSGIEKYFYEGSLIRHQLIPNGKEEIIEHCFNVYCKEDIRSLLIELSININQTNNSLQVSATREWERGLFSTHSVNTKPYIGAIVVFMPNSKPFEFEDFIGPIEYGTVTDIMPELNFPIEVLWQGAGGKYRYANDDLIVIKDF